MTNIIMDDVLASIRRLVSEESAEDSVQDKKSADRFILTPALRVPDAAIDDRNAGGSHEPQQPDPSKGQPPPAELTEVLAAAAAVAKIAEKTKQAEAPAPSPEFEAMETAWKAELDRVAAARQDAALDGEPGSPSLEHQIAELEAAVGQTKEDWEPDGSEPDAKMPPRRHIFEVVSNTADQDNTDADADFDAAAKASVPVFSHASVARPKPYLLSDAVAPTGDDGASDPVATADIDDPIVEPADIVDGDDVFLDVEALRTMITEVVRDELHGKLGETITRNVRRMIQQEITKAISDQRPDDDF